MDGRTALRPDTKLTFYNYEGGAVSYDIRREIGRGGSSIAYDASYTDNLGNAKLVRVKECYPYGMCLVRREDGTLEADHEDAESFENRKRRFIEAYQQNHDLFSIEQLTNSISNTSDLYQANHTVYIVSTYSNSQTLAEHRCANLHECVSLLVSAGRVLQRIHKAGYLYLDLKPENILVLNGSTDLVQLFDFDSLVHVTALRENQSHQFAYTRGFAPLELQMGQINRLGWHSDVYSLGAVLFYLLWLRVPTAFDCDGDASYDFTRTIFSGAEYPDRLYRELTDFFHRTLASYPGDRYATMPEALEHLKTIARLSDEMLPWLASTPFDAPVFFTGREDELTALDELLHQPNQHVFSLYGIGGIGKSTLAREYLSRHRAEYDAVLFLHDNGSLDALLGDDQLVCVNTVQKYEEEPAEEYLTRKLDALRKLCEEQSILVVLDNFAPEHLNNISNLLELGWKVLLISREAFPESFFPSLQLNELSIENLAKLFAHFAHCELKKEADIATFMDIVNRVGGHTLLIELIARQISRNYLSLHEAAALTEKVGITFLSYGRIDYVRDRKAVKTTIQAVLDQLMEVSRYTEQERRIIKLLSLFDPPGILGLVFRVIANLEDMERVNALEDSGWLKMDQNRLALHPVLREYVQGWPWQSDENFLAFAEELMERLYSIILPEAQRPDIGKQFPEDYGELYPFLCLAEQVVNNLGIITPASQRLRCRLILDAPVDQYETMLRRADALLSQPQEVEPDSVLRVYNHTALLLNKIGLHGDALEALSQMKCYLTKHNSAYYRALHHDTTACVLHEIDAEGNLKKCVEHQEKAIFWARRSKHPDSDKLLIRCLVNHAMTLLDVLPDADKCGKLIEEAVSLAKKSCSEYDDERYSTLCVAAMYHARLTHNTAEALKNLHVATHIADVARDSTMSYADHLLDECAPIYCEMGLYEEAVDAILEAVALCEDNMAIAVYRRLRFDACLFLARVYADSGDYARSERVYDQLEAYREDSPYSFDDAKPLCPPLVREKAKEQRDMKN